MIKVKSKITQITQKLDVQNRSNITNINQYYNGQGLVNKKSFECNEIRITQKLTQNYNGNIGYI